MSLTDAAPLLGMSRSGAYRAAAAGLLPVVVVGGRRRLLLDDVYALAGTRPPGPPAAHRPIVDHG
jgi:predicted site-specific integrase-resolvase